MRPATPIRSSERLTAAVAFLAMAGGAVTSTASAQGSWSVTRLHPDGASESRALGVYDNQQVGFATFVGADHAMVWSSSAESGVDLHPAGFTESQAVGVCKGQQVGWASIDNIPRASMWAGSAASWMNLHPESVPPPQGWSEARATDGSRQAGFINISATIWTGASASASSLVVPVPARAVAIDGTALVGVFTQDGIDRGVRWDLANGTWLELTPPGAFSSAAFGAHSGEQVGTVRFSTYERASLWRGSADTWTDLHPGWAVGSAAWAVHDGRQVGVACVIGNCFACIWEGTSASWLDLHEHLPDEFTESYARGIWSSNAMIRVAGYGYNTEAGRYEALLWQNCRADFDQDGSIIVPDIFAFLSDWFAGDFASANFNRDSFLNVADIFAFLSAWFEGCG